MRKAVISRLKRFEEKTNDANIILHNRMVEWCGAMMKELGMDDDDIERFSIDCSTSNEFTLCRDDEPILDAISTEIVMSFSKEELLYNDVFYLK